MAKSINSGASIECQKSHVAARKISNPVLVIIPGINGVNQHRLFKYKTGIRSVAKIVEELDPKNAIIDIASNLDLNDEIEGPILEIYTIKREKAKIVSNYSHVHSIQSIDFSDFTYAKIITPWGFVIQKDFTEINAPQG
jgi:hypothetical protein